MTYMTKEKTRVTLDLEDQGYEQLREVVRLGEYGTKARAMRTAIKTFRMMLRLLREKGGEIQHVGPNGEITKIVIIV